MVSWDQYRVDAHEAKLRPKHLQPDDVQGVKIEGDLHNQIEEDLKRRRFYFVHSRRDKKTTNQLGTTDFIIAAPNGLTLWLEVKRHGGKLSEEQNITRHCLMALNHKHGVVYSFRQYESFIQNAIQK